MQLAAITVTMIILSSGCGKDDAKPGDKGSPSAPSTKPSAKKGGYPDLPIESGKIVYALEGIEAGTVTIWFAERGQVAVVQRELTKPSPVNQISVWKDGRTTIWKVGDAKAASSPFRSKESELRVVSTTDPSQLEQGGYSKSGEETIAGKPCTVWANAQFSFCRWNDVDLRFDGGGSVKTTATSIETPAALPADLMKPPG